MEMFGILLSYYLSQLADADFVNQIAAIQPHFQKYLQMLAPSSGN
jgi:hypothetical protein